MQHSCKLYTESIQKREPGCGELICKKKKKSTYTAHRSVVVHKEHVVVKTIQEVKIKEEEKPARVNEKIRGGFVGQNARERSYILAKKIKELEMLDAYNMDHVFDVQEVLHHYSHLTSPVYLDIVDKFFINMYPDFYLPLPPVHVNKLMRRLNTVKV
ncbi:hypothetical protein DCAR_0622962 [Daucus carota subsp. sativus]|uniref:Uncharacterized protein n=1 Tax=Daucus carota subsp. sativus TaxID=79200 RepID=A0A161YAR2_DAUCS|nr:PREDICTED: uncharacterized protein LOC108225666 [Daucus carota subsp. sativus]WOH03563.1 hypothetical protein DCAR_0622962 [Daucus carota subsp. sativus]